MKVKGTSGAPPAGTSFRGAYFTRLDPLFGPVVQPWPRRRGVAKSGYGLYHQIEFAVVAQLAAHPIALDYESAVNTVPGSDWTWRDFLMRCAMGVGYDLIDPDGSHWEASRVVNPNAQLVLDLITDIPGSMLFRSPIGWIAISPGSAGQLLTYEDDEHIEWRPPPSAGLGAGYATAGLDLGAANATATASKGSVFVPEHNVRPAGAWFRADEVNGASYRATLYHLNVNTIDAILAETAIQVAGATATRLRYFPLDTVPTLTINDRYAILHRRVDATDATSSGAYLGVGNMLYGPFAVGTNFARIAKKTPAIGDVLTVGSPGYFFGLAYSL